MPPHDPTKLKESKVDKYKDLSMSVAIKKLKGIFFEGYGYLSLPLSHYHYFFFFAVTKSTFIKAMWEMNRFGWLEHGKGKLIRIAHQRLRFEVQVTKVDSKGIEIGNPVVIWINDKLLFHEARIKLFECFGLDQDYTITYKYDDKWVHLETDMDYEVCICHAKDVATLNGKGEDKILRMVVRLQVKNPMPILPLRVKEE